ncbi:ribonuclease HI [Phormidium sp. CLA17]|uniref:ribonuclease HI n=1 Tax=Leptolyngbya sp. Cla-17 TaxID=2803751 RepID=UPI0014923A76|nr:ribonuclease HI [Leptolyngbya sp. Cla-17]MBM0742392.1 ribonuclease HI [Leptolyngbya sp. Cla-17]
MIQSIYTDGACSGNPGPGGWGVVVYFSDGSRHELGGADRQTTNNRMEMQAAIAALKFLADHHTDTIELYTDSEYVRKGITDWIKGWKKKGWKTSTGKDVVNKDLWQELDLLNSKQVQWRYVRAHAGNEGNERCDAIARAFSLGKNPKLAQIQTSQIIVSDEPESLTLNTSLKSVEIELPAALKLNPTQSTSTLTNIETLEPMTSDSSLTPDTVDGASREVKVAQLRDTVEALRIADEIAEKSYLITSSELADLMDVNASAVTSRGDNWVWRNWTVSRVRREGNQILWQLERLS